MYYLTIFKHFVSIFSLIFDPIDSPFSVIFYLFDRSLLQNFRSNWVQLFFHFLNPASDNFVEYPHSPSPPPPFPSPPPPPHRVIHLPIAATSSEALFCCYIFRCVLYNAHVMCNILWWQHTIHPLYMIRIWQQFKYHVYLITKAICKIGYNLFTFFTMFFHGKRRICLLD